MSPEETSAFQDLGKALEGAPAYLLVWLVGFLTISLTDVTMTAMVVGAVALGFLSHSVLLAVVVYLFAYVAARVSNNLAGATGQGFTTLAQQVNQLNQIVLQFVETIRAQHEETDTKTDPGP